jgi:LPS-assembly protein
MTPPFRLLPLVHACACAGLWVTQVAVAESPTPEPPEWRGDAPAEPLPPPSLRFSPRLTDAISPAQRDAAPTFIRADRAVGRPDLDIQLDGNVELRRNDTVIRADRIDYYQPDDLAKARGNVQVNRAGNLFEGPELQLKIDAFEGFFLEPRYQFLRNGAHGTAARADFIDADRAVVRQATYTTCERRPGPSWLPDWVLSATVLRIDNETQTGEADGAVLRFKNVPVLAFPGLSFPLSDARKSGWLPPTIGLDNLNGLELSVPYYWNIAPQRDATFLPTVMAKRGVDVGVEFRYLEPGYNGMVRGNFMPNDRLRQRDRWGFHGQHVGAFGVPGLGPVGVAMNLNRVSDDNYWRDFSRSQPSLTQRLLPNDVNVAWSQGPFTLIGRSLTWQTLQDAAAPIVPPYDRSPQWLARWQRLDLAGFEALVELDSTRFEGDRQRTLQPNAHRRYAMATLARPWVWPGAFVTPRIRLHSTQYSFDAPLAAGGQRSAQRVVPTFSLDTGLIFERDTELLGRAWRQTLEPRAMYVYTPFRDQNFLPNYDSAANDFNFGTVYTDNAFVGHDRISDNNLLTLGLTSRLYDPQSGAETLRVGIAQRLRFADQRVTLPGQLPVSDRLSDILLGAAVNLTPRWSLDSTVQFNPDTRRSIRNTIGGRYQPGPYRVVNAAYRLQRGLSEQLDVSWQWPLAEVFSPSTSLAGVPGQALGAGQWYTVGRANYSLRERKFVDAVVGLEYDAGCWLGRVVFERLQRSNATANQRLLFQLEFVGFSRLGTNTLRSLRENIPRYQLLRESSTEPGRFTRYD